MIRPLNWKLHLVDTSTCRSQSNDGGPRGGQEDRREGQGGHAGQPNEFNSRKKRTRLGDVPRVIIGSYFGLAKTSLPEVLVILACSPQE